MVFSKFVKAFTNVNDSSCLLLAPEIYVNVRVEVKEITYLKTTI